MVNCAMKVALALAVSSIFLVGLQSQKAKPSQVKGRKFFGLETPIKNPANLPEDISECIALLPNESVATIDPDFAKDVEATVGSHRVPLNP